MSEWSESLLNIRSRILVASSWHHADDCERRHDCCQASLTGCDVHVERYTCGTALLRRCAWHTQGTGGAGKSFKIVSGRQVLSFVRHTLRCLCQRVQWSGRLWHVSFNATMHARIRQFEMKTLFQMSGTLEGASTQSKPEHQHVTS